MKTFLNACSDAIKQVRHFVVRGWPFGCSSAWPFLTLVALIAITSPAGAEVKLPALFSDNMVLQEGKKAAVWGTADPGEQVTVTLEDKKATGTADGTGRWKVELGPLKAGGPWEMAVAGSNTLTVHNVAVGEVWVDSGQSNMEFPVSPRIARLYRTGVVNCNQEVASAHYPMIRMFTVKWGVAGQPQRDAEGQWEVASPETVGQFSAVPYFFGRELHKVLGVPVGLINSPYSGTAIEAWISTAALAAVPEFKPLLDDWYEKIAAYPKVFEQSQRELARWEQAAEKAEADGARAPDPRELPGDPRSRANRPGGLYNAMIAPLIPYTMAGVIWYQGETNAVRGQGYLYRKLFPTLIQDWRRAWGAGDFPFLFVQIANFDTTRGTFPTQGTFPEVREAQLMALALPNTAMAVAIDIGDPNDLDPADKQDVAHRLALAAEALVYGRKVVYSGPLYESMSIEGSSVRLRFTHLDGGLVAKGGPLKEFQIAGEDQKFVSATAQISGDTVVVRSAAGNVLHPVAVRYGWTGSPECNMYNKAGLPASPFRTDDWAGFTESRPK